MDTSPSTNEEGQCIESRAPSIVTEDVFFNSQRQTGLFAVTEESAEREF